MTTMADVNRLLSGTTDALARTGANYAAAGMTPTNLVADRMAPMQFQLSAPVNMATMSKSGYDVSHGYSVPSGAIGAIPNAQNSNHSAANLAALGLDPQQAAQAQYTSQPYGQSQPYGATGAGLPQLGLLGYEQALNAGGQNQLNSLLAGYDMARNDATGAYNKAIGMLGSGELDKAQALGLEQIKSAIDAGIDPFQGFVGRGQQAQQMQAALSGALGPEAQQAAYDAFQESPGQAWLRQQAEQGLLRNQAALGGLGGGRVREALQAQAMGMAQQDFGNQYDRLGQLTGQGLQAAQGVGQLRGQQAGLSSGLIGTISGQRAANQQAAANAAMNYGSRMSDIAATGGVNVANVHGSLADKLAAGRLGMAEKLASSIGGTTSALGNLYANEGATMAGMIQQQGGNLAGLLSGTGSQLATMGGTLANLYANTATSSASQATGLPDIPGAKPSNIGSTLSGAAGLLQGIQGLA